MDYSTKENKMKEVLKQLYDGIEGKEITPTKLECSTKDFNSILEMAQENGYINGFKIAPTKDGGVSWTDKVTLTQKGATYLKPIKRPQTTNTFNITGNVHGSAFGSDITLTNNWSHSVENLKEYVSELPEEDKKIGTELIEAVKAEKLEKGVFSKFSSFLEKHPKLVELTGKAIVWSLLNANKLV